MYKFLLQTAFSFPLSLPTDDWFSSGDALLRHGGSHQIPVIDMACMFATHGAILAVPYSSQDSVGGGQVPVRPVEVHVFQLRGCCLSQFRDVQCPLPFTGVSAPGDAQGAFWLRRSQIDLSSTCFTIGHRRYSRKEADGWRCRGHTSEEKGHKSSWRRSRRAI